MAAGSSQAPALAGTWCRLHPLSPVARIGIRLGAVLVGGVSWVAGDQSSSGRTAQTVVIAAAAVLGVAAAVVSSSTG